jgi:hypothetical protein
LEFHFFVFQIFIVNQDTRDFQYFYVSMLHFYFCTYLMRYLFPFLRYLKKSLFFSNSAF